MQGQAYLDTVEPTRDMAGDDPSALIHSWGRRENGEPLASGRVSNLDGIMQLAESKCIARTIAAGAL